MVIRYQFIGLLRLTEYNAHCADRARGSDAATACAINTLLAAYAALEALILETAHDVQPAIFSVKRFRNDNLQGKFARFLRAAGRDESPPTIIEEVASNRVAVTHSEPNNERSGQVGVALTPDAAIDISKRVRAVAEWLWQRGRPGTVALEFDNPNIFLSAGR